MCLLFELTQLFCLCSSCQVCHAAKAQLHWPQSSDETHMFNTFLCLHKKTLTIQLRQSAKHGTWTTCPLCRACTTSAPLSEVINQGGRGREVLKHLAIQCNVRSFTQCIPLSGQEIRLCIAEDRNHVSYWIKQSVGKNLFLRAPGPFLCHLLIPGFPFYTTRTMVCFGPHPAFLYPVPWF